MKKAIVTIAAGTKYQKLFYEWFYPDWKAYAEKYGFDVLVIPHMIDTTERGLKRSASWQKCILHRYPDVCKYDQIAWIDADIRININAPNIFDFCPINKISATDAWAIPNREEHDLLLSRLYADWDAKGLKYIRNMTPQEYHGVYGLKCDHDHVVQGGLIISSPQAHWDLFEKIYSYEERGDSPWNYEMRPLSYEILESGLVHWINPRFNIPWLWAEQLYYPFLSQKRYKCYNSKLMNLFPFLKKMDPKPDCVNAVFNNSYFVHFAGGGPEYKLVPLQSTL